MKPVLIMIALMLATAACTPFHPLMLDMSNCPFGDEEEMIPGTCTPK